MPLLQSTADASSTYALDGIEALLQLLLPFLAESSADAHAAANSDGPTAAGFADSAAG